MYKTNDQAYVLEGDFAELARGYIAEQGEASGSGVDSYKEICGAVVDGEYAVSSELDDNLFCFF